MTNESAPESQPPSENTPEPAGNQNVEPAIEPPPAVLAEPAAESVPEPVAEPPAEPVESFADLLSEFERSHTHKPASGARQLQGTVISLSAEQVFLDIGYKTEGVLPRSRLRKQCRGSAARPDLSRLGNGPQ